MSTQPCPDNGHVLPMDWQGVPDDVIQRMELAYQEIQRRDAQAEQRAWRKDRLVQRLGLVIVVLVGVLVWLVLTKAQVKAFVQTVQVTDEGRLVQLGVPQHLYDYTPPDGVYMEMVAQWVRWTRWRGDDERMMQVQWAVGVSAYLRHCAQVAQGPGGEREAPQAGEQAGGRGREECHEDRGPGRAIRCSGKNI